MIEINKNKLKIFHLLFSSGMIIVIIFLAINLPDTDQAYKKCIILPIVYLLGYVVCAKLMGDSANDVKLLIILLFFLKLYLLPTLIIFNGNFNLASYNSSIISSLSDAIILQIIEWLAVVLGIILIRPKYEIIRHSFEPDIDKRANVYIWRVIGLSVIICIAAIVIYPSLILRYRPLFFSNDAAAILWRQQSNVAAKTIPAIIYYPINWLVSITRFTLVYFIIVWIWKRRKGKSQTFSLILSLIVTVVGLVLVVPDNVASSIIAALCIFLLLTKIYPDRRGIIGKIMGIAAISLFIYVFFIRTMFNASYNTPSESISALARTINAYFSGVINNAAVFEMPRVDKVEYFFGDFFRSFPVIKGFFVQMPRSTELFNKALGFDAIYNSQIIPLEGQAYFYFSYFGAFTVPMIVIKICMYFYSKMNISEGTYSFFLYSFYCLLLAFGIVMYDGFLIFDLGLSSIPLFLIHWFINKRGNN